MRVVLGTVLFVFFPQVLLRLVFGGILSGWVGVGLGCPCLVIWLASVQHFKTAILDAWRNKVAAELCGRKGFRRGPMLAAFGSLQLPNSSHVRRTDKAL